MNRPLRELLWGAALLVLAGCTGPQQGPFDTASGERASQINTRLGASYLSAGDLQQAEDKLSRAIEQDSRNADAHSAYALLQMRLDRTDRARRHFRRAMSLDPDNPQLQNNYGTFLCEQGDHDAAIAQFVTAAENRLYPTPEFAWANAGTCARDAGRPDEARRYLRRAIEANPRTASALFDMAELEYEADRFDRAMDYLERHHGVAAPSAHSLWLGIRIERSRGDTAAADNLGRRLVRNFPDSDEADRFISTR